MRILSAYGPWLQENSEAIENGPPALETGVKP